MIPFLPMARNKVRLSVALVAGTALFLGAFVAAQVLAQWADPFLRGATMPMMGLLQAGFGGMAIALALWIAGWRWSDLPLVDRETFMSDAVIGLAIAVIFAVVQFLVLIPLTGGASRSDVAANIRQIGEGTGALTGMLAFQVLGPTAEELFFRGLLLTGLASLLGRTIPAAAVATVVVTILFALGHGYQGVIGMVDTGVYGGLTLSLLFWWRKSIVAPVFAHAGWNMIAVLGLYFLY